MIRKGGCALEFTIGLYIDLPARLIPYDPAFLEAASEYSKRKGEFIREFLSRTKTGTGKSS
jgi:hypothetical protein